MKLTIIPDEKALCKCAWCNAHIDDESKVFGLGASLRNGVDFSKYAGKAIELLISTKHKVIPMYVSQIGSEAKHFGRDVMFLVCSSRCGFHLKNALECERALDDLFYGIWSLN